VLQIVRLLVAIVVVALVCTITAFALLDTTSQQVSTAMPECGRQPALRIMDLANHNASLLFCGPNLPNAALVYDKSGKWWLIAGSRVEPNSVPLSAGVVYGAFGAQIYALLPSPCSLSFKLSPRSVPKPLLVSLSPITVETPKGYNLSDYLQGGTSAACHTLHAHAPPRHGFPCTPAGRIHIVAKPHSCSQSPLRSKPLMRNCFTSKPNIALNSPNPFAQSGSTS
jgi:hypothetical protein